MSHFLEMGLLGLVSHTHTQAPLANSCPDTRMALGSAEAYYLDRLRIFQIIKYRPLSLITLLQFLSSSSGSAISTREETQLVTSTLCLEISAKYPSLSKLAAPLSSQNTVTLSGQVVCQYSFLMKSFEFF